MQRMVEFSAIVKENQVLRSLRHQIDIATTFLFWLRVIDPSLSKRGSSHSADLVTLKRKETRSGMVEYLFGLEATPPISAEQGFCLGWLGVPTGVNALASLYFTSQIQGQTSYTVSSIFHLGLSIYIITHHFGNDTCTPNQKIGAIVLQFWKAFADAPPREGPVGLEYRTMDPIL
ncbi:hypothetical protein ACLOJK_006230 [Asimina triloba]